MQRFPYIGPITLAILGVCTLSWAYADLQLALFFHGLDAPMAYAFFKIATQLGESQWYLAAGMLAFLIFRKRNRLKAEAGLFIFWTVTASGLAADLIKVLVGRSRPVLYFNDMLYTFNSFNIAKAWTSFPSGHSATAMSVAVAMALLLPAYRIPAILIGALIALSRIWIGEHYLADVIAGSWLGIVSSILLYNLHFKKKIDAERLHDNN